MKGEGKIIWINLSVSFYTAVKMEYTALEHVYVRYN